MVIKTILLLFNRPEHTQMVLASLKKNNSKDLIIFIDGPKSKNDELYQEKIFKIISKYKPIIEKIIINDHNVGLAKNITNSLDYIFSHTNADGVIVLEDDCVVNKDGIKFFNESLKYFKTDKKIRSICGYNVSINKFINVDSPFLLKRFATWGWATWKSEWSEYKKFKTRIMSSQLENSLFPKDIQMLLKRLNDKKFKKNIWSLYWIMTHYLTQTYCVYPPISIIENIGHDGSGTNCSVSSIFESNKDYKYDKKFDLKDIYYDEIIESATDDFMEENFNLIYP